MRCSALRFRCGFRLRLCSCRHEGDAMDLFVVPTVSFRLLYWPAPGSEDTELGVLMELEVGHGTTEVYARVQA